MVSCMTRRGYFVPLRYLCVTPDGYGCPPSQNPHRGIGVCVMTRNRHDGGIPRDLGLKTSREGGILVLTCHSTYVITKA